MKLVWCLFIDVSLSTKGFFVDDFGPPPIGSPGGSSTSSRDASPSRELSPLVAQLKPPIIIRKGPRGYGFTVRAIRVYYGDSDVYTVHHLIMVSCIENISLFLWWNSVLLSLFVLILKIILMQNNISLNVRIFFYKYLVLKTIIWIDAFFFLLCPNFVRKKGKHIFMKFIVSLLTVKKIGLKLSIH